VQQILSLHYGPISSLLPYNLSNFDSYLDLLIHQQPIVNIVRRIATIIGTHNEGDAARECAGVR
jgi:hypothetical protein